MLQAVAAAATTHGHVLEDISSRGASLRIQDCSVWLGFAATAAAGGNPFDLVASAAGAAVPAAVRLCNIPALSFAVRIRQLVRIFSVE